MEHSVVDEAQRYPRTRGLDRSELALWGALVLATGALLVLLVIGWRSQTARALRGELPRHGEAVTLSARQEPVTADAVRPAQPPPPEPQRETRASLAVPPPPLPPRWQPPVIDARGSVTIFRDPVPAPAGRPNAAGEPLLVRVTPSNERETAFEQSLQSLLAKRHLSAIDLAVPSREGGLFIAAHGARDLRELLEIDNRGELRRIVAPVEGTPPGIIARPITSLLPQQDGSLFASFKIDGARRDGLASVVRFLPFGGVDTRWSGADVLPETWGNPQLVELSDGRPLIVLTSPTRTFIKLNADGTEDIEASLSFEKALNEKNVEGIRVASRPEVKDAVIAIGRRGAIRALRISPDGTEFSPLLADIAFDPACSTISSLALQRDGSVVFGGSLCNVQLPPDGNTAPTAPKTFSLWRTTPDGHLDRAFTEGPAASIECDSAVPAYATCVSAVRVRPDDRIVITGLFPRIGDEAVQGIGFLTREGAFEWGIR